MQEKFASTVGLEPTLYRFRRSVPIQLDYVDLANLVHEGRICTTTALTGALQALGLTLAQLMHGGKQWT